MEVTFYGVRGSTPCSCDSNQRYGGNTACVAITAEDTDPIVLDLGTGLRFFGLTQPMDGSFRASVLLSHLHWDHVQGLPFLTPALKPGAELDIYGPRQENGIGLREAFDVFMAPPYFPIRLTDLPSSVQFHELADHGPIEVGRAKVLAREVPHIGPTLGFRIELDGVVIAYIPDHQQPGCGSTSVSPAVLELCEHADLVIHDSQYTVGEFAEKAHWGHCTVDYAVEVAAQAGAKRLVLFHHDPSHDDDEIDTILGPAARLGASRGLDEVLAASEGLTLLF